MESHGFKSNKHCQTSRFIGYKRCEANFMFYREHEDWRAWHAYNFEDAVLEKIYGTEVFARDA